MYCFKIHYIPTVNSKNSLTKPSKFSTSVIFICILFFFVSYFSCYPWYKHQPKRTINATWKYISRNVKNIFNTNPHRRLCVNKQKTVFEPFINTLLHTEFSIFLDISLFCERKNQRTWAIHWLLGPSLWYPQISCCPEIGRPNCSDEAWRYLCSEVNGFQTFQFTDKWSS